MSKANNNDWDRYSSDSDSESTKIKQQEYLRKYSKMANKAFDKNELLNIIIKHNYNNVKIESEIKERLKLIEMKGDDYGWNEVRKGKKPKPIETHETQSKYTNYKKGNNSNKFYNSSYDYSKTQPSSYRGYKGNNSFKRGNGGYKTQRRPFQECIEVPSEPIIPNNNTIEVKKEKEEETINTIKVENKVDKEQKEKEQSLKNNLKEDYKSNDCNQSENQEEEEYEEEEEEEEEIIEERNKWGKIWLNRLKTYSSRKPKKQTDSLQLKKKKSQLSNNTVKEQLSISSQVNNIEIPSSYENPNRLYFLNMKKDPKFPQQYMYPMMPIMQPIPFPIGAFPIMRPPTQETLDNKNK